MNKRVREKHAKGTNPAGRPPYAEPTPRDIAERLSDALAASAGASCALAPGVWQPAGTPATAIIAAPEPIRADDVKVDEPIECEGDPAAEVGLPSDNPFDEDVISLQAEMADARSGVDVWNDARLAQSEAADELAELEEELAREAALSDEDETDEEEPVGSTEDAKRLQDIGSDAAFMQEWESCEPLTAGITHLSVRLLADIVGIGPVATLLAGGQPVLGAFEARHGRAKALLDQIDAALAEEHAPPEALIASALEGRVSAALDRVLTAETLRVPGEIRRVIVEFRRERDARTTPLRAFHEATASLERAHLQLDEREAAVRAGGNRPPLRDVRLYGETIDAIDAGFAELVRIEGELAQIEERLERHRASFLTLCDRARKTVDQVSQVRAAAQMLGIPLPDAMSAQTDRETRRLLDAVETYTAEMDAGFVAPNRNTSVRRMETELPARKALYASLTSPRAESIFRVPVPDRDEEIRRLMLLTFDSTCNSGRVKGRSVRAVTGSILVRAGFIRAEESDHARDLFASKAATDWRQEYFDHSTVGQRGHIYIPNEAGRKLAKAYGHGLADVKDFTERVLRALQEHRAAVAEEEAAKKAAKA